MFYIRNLFNNSFDNLCKEFKNSFENLCKEFYRNLSRNIFRNLSRNHINIFSRILLVIRLEIDGGILSKIAPRPPLESYFSRNLSWNPEIHPENLSRISPVIHKESPRVCSKNTSRNFPRKFSRNSCLFFKTTLQACFRNPSIFFFKKFPRESKNPRILLGVFPGFVYKSLWDSSPINPFEHSSRKLPSNFPMIISWNSVKNLSPNISRNPIQNLFLRNFTKKSFGISSWNTFIYKISFKRSRCFARNFFKDFSRNFSLHSFENFEKLSEELT